MRNPWLNDAKGLAIVTVAVFWHAWGIAGPLPWPRGDIGVDVFVILSGFGLALSQREETLTSFYRRRLLNIGPRFWVCLIVFTLIYVALGINHITLLGFFIDAGFGTIAAPQISFVWWFLTLIVGLYGIYGPMRSIVRKGDVSTVIFIGFAAELTYSLAIAAFAGHDGWIPRNPGGIYTYIDYRILDFFIGISLAIIYQGRATFRAPALLGGVCLGLLFFYRAGSYDAQLLFYPGAGLFLLWLFFCISRYCRESTGMGWLVRTIAFVGTYSYEFYLLHGPLMQDVMPKLLPAPSGPSGELPRLLDILVSLLLTALLVRPLFFAGAFVSRATI